eukprot:GHVU01087912.1.p2 GENE.GHVU01087912.1~~GHVU01087912.1.p2  ORF type:complete len:108 (-),score=11.69 GHVU01087912.1:37-360(-)
MLSMFPVVASTILLYSVISRLLCRSAPDCGSAHPKAMAAKKRENEGKEGRKEGRRLFGVDSLSIVRSSMSYCFYVIIQLVFSFSVCITVGFMYNKCRDGNFCGNRSE